MGWYRMYFSALSNGYEIKGDNNHEFTHRNIIIGENGSGKTRLLKMIRDYYLHNDKRNMVYLDFTKLNSSYQIAPKNEQIEYSLFDIKIAKLDMSFDDFVILIEKNGIEYLREILQNLHGTKFRSSISSQSLKSINEFLENTIKCNIIFNNDNIYIVRESIKKELIESLTLFSPGELFIFISHYF